MASTSRPGLALGATLVALTSATAALWISEDRLDRIDCMWLAVSWAQYATSYLAVFAAVLAVVLAGRSLSARARVHGGMVLCLVVSVLLVVFGGFMVYATHDNAAEVAGKVGDSFCL